MEKIFSLFPGRSCLKIIGEPSLILTKIPTIKIIGDKTMRAIPDNRISKILFQKADRKFFYASLITLLIVDTTYFKSSSVIFVSDGKHTPKSNKVSATSSPI